MIEVPVKLDASWAPIILEEPEPAALRVMSDPGILEHQHVRHLKVRDPHPGRRVSGYSDLV
jgi:hypothetical protein